MRNAGRNLAIKHLYRLLPKPQHFAVPHPSFCSAKIHPPPGEGITDAKGTETAYTFDNFGRYENITVDNGAGLTYNYSNGKLFQIQRKADGTTTLAYHFVYDEFGNTEEIKVGNKLLASYDYIEPNGLLLSQSYGNEDSVSFTYDNLGRAKTTTYSSGRVLSYIYTGDGQLYSVHDSATGYTYIYTYDSLGRLIASRVEDSSSQELMRTKLWYNASNQITKQTWTVGDTTYQETYAYNTGDATLSSYQNALGQTVSLGYDFLRRLSTVTAGNIYTQTYTYRDIDESKTTTQVSGLAYSGFTGAPSYGYTYDVLGNIATYTENGTVYTYTYDDLNQLLTATGGGKAWAYTYDLGGNILTATDGTTSHTYTYGDPQWADLLTAYDGQTITYDGSGNPLSYYNGSRYTFAWAEGRRLTSAAVNGKTYTYAYDSDGLRLSKTVDGATHNYFYASGNLLRETWGTNILDFFYDNTGSPYALNYNGTTYYYITNLQGDVLGLIDASGNTVASYTYDPYGKVLTATGTMAETNPLRYRGYYYDSETELYYLQSRYYDPTTCRFINADAYASTGQGILGHNMFAYCNNSPTSRMDISGTWGASVANVDDYDPIIDWTSPTGGGGGTGSASATVGCVLVAGVGTVGAMGLNEFLKLLVGPVDLDFIPIEFNSVSDIVSEYAYYSKTKAIAQSISNSYAAAKTVSSYKSPREVHHIVAKKAPNAQAARDILDDVGIEYNSPDNLVSLKTGLHRRLHTNLYYSWANSIVISAYHSANGDKTLQRAYVLTALNTIRMSLLLMDQVAPY